MSPPEPRPHDSESAATRQPSLWPDTGHMLGPPSSQLSRFDPLADERARLAARAQGSFDVCHPALALRAVLLVQAVLALWALAGASHADEWLARQAVLAFAGAGATLLWLVLVCALRAALQKLSALPRAALVLGLGAAIALGVWAPLAWAGLVRGGPWQASAVALGGLALAAVVWAWLGLRARIWQPATANARLAELQSRIRPHFLFNTLNSAITLVQLDPARAEAVLEDLSQLFRAALAEVGESVTLDEEVELARRYLDIEAVRFGPRLNVRWSIDTLAGPARVPPLLLQPLVENAVRHGVEPSPQGGQLRVRTQRQRGQVVVTVSNTLGDEPGSPGHGMALHNIRERLRLLHDVAAQCDVWREPGPGGDWFHARITLPAP
jgi:two-component system, LytTR family, sensor histidine kinase AlgZ